MLERYLKVNFNIKRADRSLILWPLVFLTLIVGGSAALHTGLALTLGIVLASLWIIAVQIHLFRSSLEELQHVQRQNQALMSLHHALPLRRSLPSLSGWAITPEVGVILMEVIEREQCRSVLELGSGASTLISGYALQKQKFGRILSLDHDRVFLEKTRMEVLAHGLEDVCNVIYAPLIWQECGDTEVLWYDTQSFEMQENIDLVIVDGPPMCTQDLARYPALPLLSKYFADRVTIILDDAARNSEQEILEKWRREFPSFRIETISTVKGTAILRREGTRDGF